MPNIADVFNSDAFGVVSLTKNINNIPYTPSTIEAMGIYEGDTGSTGESTGEPTTDESTDVGGGGGAGIDTQQLAVVNNNGLLQLIPAAALGTMPNFQITDPSDIRYITVPHLPLNDSVLAHEVVPKVSFGDTVSGVMTETALRNTIEMALTKKQQLMVKNHRLTWEWMRVQSLKGVLLDANGTDVIYDWFTEFGINKKTITWTAATLGDIDRVCDEINAHMADVLGQDSHTGITIFVGNQFMTELTKDPSLNNGFIRLNEGAFYRENYVYGSFHYKGIDFVNYRGTLGGIPYFADTEGIAVPRGTNAFIRRNAPGDLLEAVGRDGLPMYSAREMKKFGLGWDLHSQSNPIFMAQRPGVIVEVTGVFA